MLKALAAFLLLAASVAAGAPVADDAAQLVRAGLLSDAARTAGELPLDPADAAWERAPKIVLALTPQRSVTPGLEAAAPIPLEVRALVGGNRLAVRLGWTDASEDRYRPGQTTRFADAAAVQFAAPGAGLPYIGMGEAARPVGVWFWRAGHGSERLAARGFGTLERDPGPAPRAVVRRTASGWALVLAGELPATANPLPVAFAIWDGVNAERDGRKRLTRWHLLALPGVKADADWLKALAAEAALAGDAGRGQRLAQERGCAACHTLPGAAPSTLGPDLTVAGAQHWPGYLRRSVSDPSAFIVPGKGYAQETRGQRISLMPRHKWNKDELEDIVAYLAGLGKTETPHRTQSEP